MTERVEILVIGAGQAGLAVARQLGQRGLDCVVLEQERIGESWLSRRWDSFRLVTPRSAFQLGGESIAPASGEFLSAPQTASLLARYADSGGIDVHCHTKALSLCPRDSGGFTVPAVYQISQAREYEADCVVLATGAYQRLQRLPHGALPGGVVSVGVDEYRRPDCLPMGAVLVVGSGQSGTQIADDLLRAGREVYLSTGICGWVPRHYRGRDITEWLIATGLTDQCVDRQHPARARLACHPQVSGREGGGDLNVHTLAHAGAHLVGRLQHIDKDRLIVADDLAANLDAADTFAVRVRTIIDEYARRHGVPDVADDPWPAVRPIPDQTRRIPELRLGFRGIRGVVWAGGYRPDFAWTGLRIFDQSGFPLHRRGVSRTPGLYFLGLPWLWKWKSATLLGIEEDAEFIADHIAAHRLGSSRVRQPSAHVV